MNQLIEANKLTMSSLEIAELTGKLHKNVLADIRTMLSEIGSAEKLADYKDSQGRTYPMLLLNREETDCLITGYSAKLRMTVIKRWHELEANKNALPNFNDPVEAARAWADVKENEIKALEVIKEQAPKVNYFDKVSRNETNMSATQVAQKFGLTAIMMNRHLTELGIYNRAVKRTKTFTQDFISKGYGRMIMSDRGFSQAVFTPKGEQYVTELLTSEGII